MTLEPALLTRLSRYLPHDILAKLPDPHAMADAIRHLNSLHQAVSSFLPQYIADNETLYSADYADLRPGTFLFADVSGFTALSERLQAAGGDAGTEILTRIINDFFARMLEILAKSNGQLLKFAGDALEAFFPAPRRGSEVPLAIRTGLRMQREMKRHFQPIRHPELVRLFGEHDFELSMSIGICQGKLFEAVVGNDIQRDHIIQGDLPGQAMAAEEAGRRDDVIITAALNAAHGDEFDTVALAEGFFHVVDNLGDALGDYEFVVPRRRRGQSSAIFGLEEKDLRQDLEENLARLEGVARFVAREVVDRLAAGGGEMEPDNRPATVIFNHFTGFADLLDAWGEEHLSLIVSLLDRYYNLMQRTAANNGGSVTRTDPYKRGVKMLITFGAPVAHPDDPERAVTTALEMNRQLANLNTRLQDELPDKLRRNTYITQRIGITQGMVYAGEVGWKSRREYTVMGDDVNLAARLMSKGEPGQILISQRVWERVHPHFATEALDPMPMKGKSKPVQAYLVKASTASVLSMSSTSDTPFVGRDLHLLSLTYALQQAKGPRRRQAFALIGEAGTGKTRMAKQVVQAAEAAGFQVAWANCQLSHVQAQHVWPALLFQVLQLEQAKSERGQRRLLHARLNELGVPDLEATLSMMLFDIDTPFAEPDDTTSPETAPDDSTNSPASATGNGETSPDIFALVGQKAEIEASGIWGRISDRIDAQLASDTPTGAARPFWQAVEKRLNQTDSIVQVLQAHADSVPTLLVIDDLHRADALTLNTLARVLDEIRKAELMLLVTYEPSADIDLRVRRKITVSDLEEHETAQMAASMLGVQDLDPKLHELVWQRTSGRPLFVESLLGLLDSEGHIVRHDSRAALKDERALATLPDNVRELILSRIDHLSPESRRMLQIASVFGDGFSVEALLALSEDTVDEIRIENLFGEMLHEEIIETLPDNTFRFRHGVTQTTVYENLNRRQRQRIHCAVAEWLQSTTNAERNVLRIVHHWIKGGLPARGIELVALTAQQAEQRQQFDRALELYTHAVELFPHDETLQAALQRLQNA